jgi:hypothetical protein
VVEPAQLGLFLNLEQAELLRIQRYNEAWRFYFGKHWAFKREDGEPLVTVNYFRKFIDKQVEFLVSKGFVNVVPAPLEQVTKPFLDEVWEYNMRDQFAQDAALMGAATGDVFVLITYEEPTEMQRKINPFSQGRIKINLLGSEQVFPTWDPLDQNRLIAVRIETIYYSERNVKSLDRDDRVNHDGRSIYVKRFTQIITPDQIVEQFHGEMPVVRPNPLGEIPLVHIKNFSVPKEYYGFPSLMDLTDLQRELNEKKTDVSDTINYQGSPTVVITGAKAKQLERGPRQIWSGLPENARVSELNGAGDLAAANKYIDETKMSMHELADIPEGCLGKMQPISNTSGVALHHMWQPLIGNTDRRKVQYEPGFAQINYFVMRVAQNQGLLQLPWDLCKTCGGRIIDVEVPGQTTKTWDPAAPGYSWQVISPEAWAPGLEITVYENLYYAGGQLEDRGRYLDKPLKKKTCYHIDKQTLDFVDPNEMKLKMWRQYGFGGEVREMTYRDIVEEVQSNKTSFWDYGALDKKAMDAWREQCTAINAENHAQATVANQQPPPQQVDANGLPVQQPPQVQQRPLPPQPLPTVKKLPIGEVEVPEEPVMVALTQPLSHPQTGAVVDYIQFNRLLVPTGCQNPAYLNPFENAVKFNDVLPKDQALEMTYYEQLLRNDVVDTEWVQLRIPEVRENMIEINKRLKAKLARGEPTSFSNAKVPAAPYGQPRMDVDPTQQQMTQVPGQNGNPVQMGQQAQ